MLIRRSLFLHTVIAVLLGTELNPAERAALDQSITRTFQPVGITADPRPLARAIGPRRPAPS